jgi:DNA adenine methylase
MKTPISWYGGKQMMLKYILPIIPQHKVYTESFFGGGAVFFSKEPAKTEVINDMNKEAMNFYYTTQVSFKQLQQAVTTTLHSRDAYRDAVVVHTHPHLFDEVKRAWAFHTMASQSFSSNFSSWGYDRVGTTSLKISNKRLNFTQELSERLNTTTIENDDALKVIQRYDTTEAFHFIDPPYFNSECGHYKGFSRNDMERLLDGLSGLQGKFLLASYPSDLLDGFIKTHGWDTWSIEKKVAVSGKVNKTKVEVLTANYPIKERLNTL